MTPTYEDVVRALEDRGDYAAAETVRYECPGLHVRVDELDLRYDLQTRRAIDAAERVLREDL